jgi:hypothetical protein
MAEKCTAHRSDGEPCSAWEIPDTGTCYFHGQSPMRVKRANVDRNVLKAATELMHAYGATMGAPLQTSPAEFMLDELNRTNGHVAWLQERILTDAPDEIAKSFWLFARSTESNATYLEMADLTSYAGVWLKLYMEERKHGVNVAERAARAGIEDRYIRIAEQQADLVAAVIKQVITELGHDVNNPVVRAVAHRALTSINAGAVTA